MERKKRRSGLVGWNHIPSTPQANDIPITPEVITFEQAYNLPSLKGTPRQTAWGRLIRHQIMGQVFKGIMDATTNIPDPKPIYERVDQLRAETQAAIWINDHRPHLHDPLPYLLTGP